MESITCDVVRPDELGDDHRARWEKLRSGVPALASPFLSATFAERVGAVRSDARVAVLRPEGEASGEPVGFLPFHTSPTRYGRPIGRSMSNAQGVIVDPTVSWDPRYVVRRCGLRALRFELLVGAGPALAPYVSWTDVSPQVDLRAGFAAYLREARRQDRGGPKEAAKRQRQFARKLDLRFTWHDSDPAVLRTLLSWQSGQFDRTGGFDWTGRPWVRELFERLHGTSEPGCEGVLSTLRAGDELVAVQFSLRSGSHLAGWVTAYDPAWSQQSPGSVLQLALLQAAADQGVEVFDQGAGTEPYKARWATGGPSVSVAVVPAGGAAAALTAAGRAGRALARRSPWSERVSRLQWRLDTA